MKIKDYLKKHKIRNIDFCGMYQMRMPYLSRAIKNKWDLVEKSDHIILVTLRGLELKLVKNCEPCYEVKDLTNKPEIKLREFVPQKNMTIKQFSNYYNIPMNTMIGWIQNGYKAQELENGVKITTNTKKYKQKTFWLDEYHAPSDRVKVKPLKKIDWSKLSCSLPVHHIKNDWLHDGIVSHG